MSLLICKQTTKMQWTQNLCRICGRISENCHSIFSGEVLNPLDEKFKKCFTLNLCNGDYKPKQICNGCELKLNEFSEFVDTCYATNQKFESIYLNSQTWQSRIEYPPSQKQSVIVSNKQVPDNLDFELYRNTGIVLENPNINNCQLNDTDVLEIVGETNYSTENCSDFMNTKMKSSYVNILKHPSNNHIEGYNVSEDKEQSAVKNELCYVNSSYNLDSSNIEGECVKNAENLKKQTITVEEVQNNLKHPISSFQKETVKKLHSCPHCAKVFSRRGTLNSHIATHTNLRPYKCNDCSKSFPVKSELTTHRKVHGDQHICLYCAKRFSVPSKLQRHLRIHTNTKPFMCNFANCKKAFSDKHNLQGHKLIHTFEKNYSCPVCMKLFKTINRLKQHSKSHTCSIMYTCDLCSKMYKYKSNLISHIKKHNNICPYCKVNCESKTVLAHHIKICKARW